MRDLTWVIASPPLLQLSDAQIPASFDPQQVNSDHLLAFFADRSEHRVGHYFENLIHYWLVHIRGVELLAHRQPVHDGDRRLGELDFIFRDETGQLTHWEVAVKFYLQSKTKGDQSAQFLGPNTSDSLERKLARMRDHQLPLSRLIYPEIAKRQAFVKGRIYYHPSADTDSLSSDLCTGHLRGTWLHAYELQSYVDSFRAGTQFSELKKPFWFTPSGEPSPISKMPEHVDRQMDEPTVHNALFDENGFECQRLFIVPDSWPFLER